MLHCPKMITYGLHKKTNYNNVQKALIVISLFMFYLFINKYGHFKNNILEILRYLSDASSKIASTA